MFLGLDPYNTILFDWICDRFLFTYFCDLSMFAFICELFTCSSDYILFDLLYGELCLRSKEYKLRRFLTQKLNRVNIMVIFLSFITTFLTICGASGNHARFEGIGKLIVKLLLCSRSASTIIYKI